MSNSHELLGGKVHLFKRPRSPYWWCSATVGEGRFRESTKEEGLSQAKAFAEDWYLELKGKHRWGGGIQKEPSKPKGPTFEMAADKFLNEFEVIAGSQRSPRYVDGHKGRVKNHLIPFFGTMALRDITSGTVQDYRVHRTKAGPLPGFGHAPKIEADGSVKAIRPLGKSTLHQELVCLRQILKTALRHRWIDAMPDLSAPYKSSVKIRHRAWFSPEEYKRLYTATRDRAQNPPNPRWAAECENLHDFVLFMVNTGLRPDEALRLEYRDVQIVNDDSTDERILEIEVRGKRGVGFCKSMPGAVQPFKRIKQRNFEALTDRIFPSLQRELFNTVLTELGLKQDRDGQPRTFYSLRHTYICLRLMEGADIYQVAKNCRTSVEMIEKHYAAHIKNVLDASAINVRKTKRKSKVFINEEDIEPRERRPRGNSRSTARGGPTIDRRGLGGRGGTGRRNGLKPS